MKHRPGFHILRTLLFYPESRTKENGRFFFFPFALKLSPFENPNITWRCNSPFWIGPHPNLLSLFEQQKWSPWITMINALRVCALSHFSHVWLCNLVDYSPPGSSVHGIALARVLEWVAISSSRGSSRPRDQTCISSVSCIGRWILYHHPFYLPLHHHRCAVSATGLTTKAHF